MKQNYTGKLIMLLVGLAIVAMIVSRLVTTGWILSDEAFATQKVTQVVWTNFAIELMLLLVGLWIGRRLIVRDRISNSQLDRTAHLADIALMSGGLAHEARNHIHAMKSHFALIRKRTDDSEKVLERLAKLESVSDDLQSLLTDFLTFARPARDDLSELNLIELIAELIELQKPSLEQRTIELQFDHPSNLPMLCLDRQKIRSAIMNLIVNAGDAIQRDGKIQVRLRHTRLRHTRRRVFVEVEDDGCGISPDEQQRIFQSFFTTKSGGTGLGLAIVQRTIQDMNGRISVQSEIGKGTTFTIDLPLRSQGSSPAFREAKTFELARTSELTSADR